VFVGLPIKSGYEDIQKTFAACERVGVPAKYPTDLFRTTLAPPRLEQRVDTPLIAVTVAADDYRLVVKRGMDVVGAIALLVLCLPFMVIVAIAIKLSSPGPAFFAHERFGYMKRRFRMYKFRTMVTGAEQRQAELEDKNEAIGPVFKIRDDPRITGIGRWLRRTSLDELPQLWHVLMGEMSLVGPRPLPVRDVGRFSEPWLMRRFSVRPGLTCLWQITGRSDLGFAQWIALDLEYINRWSFWLDCTIILRTIPAVLKGRGAL
jgi:exopolysaccharide biosynthesis polyprenyl glycosylphosphotransferase